MLDKAKEKRDNALDEEETRDVLPSRHLPKTIRRRSHFTLSKRVECL